MGTSLTGLTPSTTYDALIKVGDNGPLSGTLKTLSDGLGNDSALALSTGGATITGTLSTSSILRGERVQVGTAATLNDPTGVGNTLQFANYSPSVFVTGSADSYIYKNSGAFSGLSAQSLIFQTRSDTTGGGFAFVAGGTPAPIVTMLGSGNVGIGTATPTSNLEIFNDGTGGELRLSRDVGGQRGIISYGRNNGGSFQTAVKITGDSDGGSGAYGVLRISTTNGASTLSERINISQDGIKFNGDSAAANALDDYEEGTFTPTFVGSTTAGTYIPNNLYARYTKIGNQVTVQVGCNFSGGASGGLGNMLINGLPFNYANNSVGLTSVFTAANLTYTANYLTLLPSTSGISDQLIIVQNVPASGYSFVQATGFGTSTDIRFTFSYFV